MSGLRAALILADIGYITECAFLNSSYDAYVHGSYETAMELCDPHAGQFMMRGHQSTSKRDEFIEAAFLRLHEVVLAVEFTAAVTANAAVSVRGRPRRAPHDGCI